MAYTGTSIVDYLNQSGQASDYNTRAKLAASNGISNYTGTADQNLKLLSILNKPASTTSTTQSMGSQASAPYITPPATANPTLPASQTNNSSMSTINNQLNSPGVQQVSGPTMPTAQNTTQAPVDIKAFNQQMVAGNTNPTITPANNNATSLNLPQSSNPNVLTLNSTTQNSAPSAPTYTIKAGDNLSTIAKNNNTTVAELMKINPQISDPNVIKVGNNVILPSSTPTTTPTPASGTLDMTKLTGQGLSAPIGSNTALQGLLQQLTAKGNSTGGTQNTTTNYTSQGSNSTTSVPSPYNNTSPNTQNTPPASSSTQNSTSTQPYNAYGGLISQLIQQTQMGAREKQLRDQQSQLQLDLADRVNAEASNPIPLEFQTGRISALQNLAAQRDKAISSQIANEQKQREIAGQALGAGVTAMAPVQVAPQNTYINPATGQVVANPNYQNLTNYAQAQQNIKIGQDAQTEAARLNTTLNQLKTIEPTITSFMQQAGINPFDIQVMNSPMNSYKQFIDNPANATSFNAMMADVKTYTAQILGSSGLNPTEVSATVNSFDPSSLTPVQLKAFLQNLDNLGQIRLQPLQQTMNQAYNQNSTLGAYAGQQAQVNPNNVVLPNNNVVNPLTGEPMGVMGQLGAGTALQSGAGLIQLLQALAGK